MVEKDRISRMTEEIQKVGSGDYSVNIELSGKDDDLDTLARGLNIMVDEIRTSYQELQKSYEISLTMMNHLNKREKEIVDTNKILRDKITECKRVEDLLLVRNQAIESSLTSMAISDIDGKLTYVNDACVKLWGYNNSKEFTGRNITEFWHKKGIPQTIKQIQKKGKDVGEGVGKRKDGSIFQVLFTANIIKDEKGNPVSLIGTFMDISERKKLERKIINAKVELERKVMERTSELRNTDRKLKREIEDRKQAENLLRESKERLSAFMNSVTDGFILYDSELNHNDMNASALKIIGQTRADIIGKNILDMFPDVEKSGRYIKYKEVIRTGKSIFLPGLLSHRKFGELIIDLKAFRVEDGLGIIFRDVTKRLKAKKSLHECKERLTAFMNEATDGFILYDSALNHIDINESALKIIGQNRADIIGKNILDVFPDVEESGRYIEYSEVIETGKSLFMRELISHHKFGKLVVDMKAFRVEDGLGIVLTDITKRLKAEKSLQESEERFRGLFENAPIGIYCTTAGGKILMANPKLVEMLGFQTLRDLKRKNLRGDSFVSQGARQKFMAKMGDKGEVIGCEETRELENSRIIHIRESSRAQKDQEYNVLYYEGIVEDITNHKKAEEEAIKWKYRYDSAVAASRNVLYDWNSETNHVTYGGAAKEVLGYTLEELSGDFSNWIALIHRDDRGLFCETIEQLIVTKESVQLQYRVRKKDGSYIYVEDAGKFAKESQGSAMRLIGFVKEITECKNTEEVIRQSEEKFRSLFNEDISGNYVTTTSGTFLLCNRAFVDMFGLSSLDEVYKMDVSALYENKKGRKVFLDQLVRKKKLSMYEHKLVKKNGEIITVLENAIGKFNDNDELIQINGYLFDITKRKQSENKLKSTLRQLRNLAAHFHTVREEERTLIARNIHDDMGQILAVIKINLSLIENEIKSEKEHVDQAYLLGELKDMLNIIDNATLNVKKLITELRPEVLDNLGLLEALKWLAGEFEKRSRFKCSYTSDVTHIDLNNEKSTAIFRIFQEVLTNVSNHSKATEVKIDFNKTEDHLVLKVDDNGVGFSKKKAANQKSFGLLGMSERAIVFGGKLVIATRKGKGTIVILSIPVA